MSNSVEQRFQTIVADVGNEVKTRMQDENGDLSIQGLSELRQLEKILRDQERAISQLIKRRPVKCPYPNEVHIDKCGISRLALNALRPHRELSTVGKLKRVLDKDLLSINSFGTACLTSVRNAIGPACTPYLKNISLYGGVLVFCDETEIEQLKENWLQQGYYENIDLENTDLGHVTRQKLRYVSDIRTVAQLKEAFENGKLSGLPGIGGPERDDVRLTLERIHNAKVAYVHKAFM